MKKFVLLIISFVGLLPLCAQEHATTYTHAFATWLSGGYSRFERFAGDTRTIGGPAAAVGLGYEYGKETEGFILQTGVSLSPQISNMKYLPTLTTEQQMLDTEGTEHTAIFTVHDGREKDFYLNANLSVLFGYQWDNGWHLLFGPQAAYTLMGNSSTTCKVTTANRYEGIIGEDGNGLLSNMPNHQMTTVSRTTGIQPISSNPYYVGGVFEVGYNLLKNYNERLRLRGKNDPDSYHTLRISVFGECGCYINPDATAQTTPTTLLIDQHPAANRYEPLLNKFLYYEQSHTVSMFYGIKFTYLFHRRAKECNCEEFAY